MNAPDPIAQIQRAAIDGAVHIPLELLRASPTNPRKHFDQAHLDELADSIRKHGVIQPILARLAPAAKRGEPLYEVIAGERRWRASKIAGAPSIPALVRDMSDFEVLELQVIENLQREDLHPLEEAEGFAALLRRPDGLQGYASAEEIAARIGRSERHVYNRLALLKLVPQAREACLEGKISASVALLVAALSVDDQPAATEKLALGWGGEPYSARAAAAYLRDHFSLQLKKAPFPIADAALLPAAGACSACPKRTCANPDLFTDQAGGGIDSCLDRQCFDAKTKAHHELALAAHRAKGHEVLTEADAKKLMPYGAQSLRGAYLLDEPCALATSRKPLRQLLGQYAEVVVIDLHETLYEVAREAYVKKTLKTNGYLKPPAKKDEPRKQQPESLLPKPAKGKALTPAEIKAARDRAIAQRWPELAREQLGKHLMADERQKFTEGLQRMVVGFVLNASNAEMRPMLQAVGIAWPANKSFLTSDAIDRLADQATPQQLYALLVLAMAEANEWELGRDPKADVPLRKVARELGFDLQPAIDTATEEVQERMKAELEQLKAPAPAPAAKKAAAKKPAKAKDATQAFVDAHSGEVLIGGEPLKVGDRARVRKTATGRKTAKDGREGTIHSVGDDGRVLLKWGDKPHERGVYEPAELEPVAEREAGALKPTVKYRCPLTGSTWSGRGLQPAWVKAALANGKKLDELLATAEEQTDA